MDKNELIDYTLDQIDFDKIYKVTELYHQVWDGLDYYPDMMMSAYFQGESAEGRKVTPESLRKMGKRLLLCLFDDDYIKEDDLIMRNISHGCFSAEVTHVENNEIKAISLKFIPIISEGWYEYMEDDKQKGLWP